jgi:O-antigen/teichoic acid export membrane protein
MIILARLLTPRELGSVAIGASLVLVGAALSDAGLGASLIRRAEPPRLDELQALTALQLAITCALALGVASIATQFGQVGSITALMVSCTPLFALQLPGRILLERSLSYPRLAFLEITQVVVFYVWAIALVVVGFGVWGLATATIARAVAATLIVAHISPVGLVRPRLSWAPVRPLIAFGLRFSATDAAWLVREPALNVSLAALANVFTLGLWSLASRVMQVPALLFESLFRVSFPTMARLVARGENTAPLIERAVGMAAVGGGIGLTALAGSAPGLIPGVFGEQWRGASSVIPGACLGLAIGSSVGVATQGYLQAVGDASAVLRAMLLQTVTLLVVALSLVPFVGVGAVGIGLAASSAVLVIALRRATLRRMRVPIIRPLVVPIGAGVASAAVGWTVTVLLGEDLLAGLAGGSLSTLLFVGCLLIVRRQLILDVIVFAARSARAGVGPRPHPADL